LLQDGDRVLDVGCGSGLFLPSIYKNTTQIHAVDTSPALLEEARSVVENCKLEGTVVMEADVEKLAFEDASFDAIIAVDVLHHFQNLDLCLNEMKRVLRPGGKLIIFEPNKLNPLLALGCLIDRNEWGLLALGRRGLYKHRISPFFDIKLVQFNGLIIGPDERIITSIADFVTRKPWSRILSWLAPKILILAEKSQI
jgi:ubiquinone/menaquinone biosynthesis C-methylase UbiE